MSKKQTSLVLSRSISLPVLEDGREPCASPDGRMAGRSGLARALALPSRAPAKVSAALTAKAATLSRILTRRESLSAFRAGRSGMRTAVTSSPSSAGSLTSTALQQYLENRLQARMAAYGSPEYELRWSKWDMPLGVPICALRASGRRTSGKDYSGWRTPTAGDAQRGVEKDPRIRNVKAGTGSLNNEAAMAGWPTPNAMGGGQTSRGGDRKEELLLGGLVQTAGWPTPKTPTGGANSNRESRGAGGADLQEAVQKSGWPTPRAEDSESAGAHRGSPDTLTSAARAGWPTPTACTGPNMSENRGKNQGGRRRRITAQTVEGILAGWPSPTSSMMTEQDLSQAMTAGNGKNRKAYQESKILAGWPAGWPTPTVQDSSNNAGPSQFQRNSEPLNVMVHGQSQGGSNAATEKRGGLNPAFPCWLMGFLPAWCDCAVMAMQSYRPLRLSSSRRPKKQGPSPAAIPRAPRAALAPATPDPSARPSADPSACAPG